MPCSAKSQVGFAVFIHPDVNGRLSVTKRFCVREREKIGKRDDRSIEEQRRKLFLRAEVDRHFTFVLYLPSGDDVLLQLPPFR